MHSKFTFDPETHTGRYNGEYWPSVTGLLNLFKIVNYDHVPPDVLEAKRILGTRVDAAIRLLDNDNLDEADLNERFPECVPYVNAYHKFRYKEKYTPNKEIIRLYSRKWKFHGEPDTFGILNNEESVIDYKCTFQMYASVGPQTAGYDMLLKENYILLKIKNRFGLLLKPTGDYDLKQFKDRTDYTDIQACLYLFWQCKNKYKTIKELLS